MCDCFDINRPKHCRKTHSVMFIKYSLAKLKNCKKTSHHVFLFLIGNAG